MHTLNDVARTWHQNNEGQLCLYTTRHRDTQPWADADNFLSRVDQWFVNNERGWPDDYPALDIEVYLKLPYDIRFVLHPDLIRLTDDYVRVDSQPHLLRVLGPGKRSKKANTQLLSGYVSNIGELHTPPITFRDLLNATADTEHIRGAIERGPRQPSLQQDADQRDSC